jgi:excisionase family DNA binding protein
MQQHLLTKREAAERLRVSTSTVDRIIGAGELPTVRLGSRVLISSDDLGTFIGAHRGPLPASHSR